MENQYVPPRQAEEGVGDDRVLPVTRWVALLLVPLSAAASVVLFVFPGLTGELFAWTVRPELTAVVMGAGYGAIAYFFARVALAQRWHTVSPVFLGLTLFTWLTTLTIWLHLGRFDQGSVAFTLWAGLHAVGSVLLPTLWLVNRFRSRRVPEIGDLTFSLVTRVLVGVLAVHVVLVALVVVLLSPILLINSWPWTVTPLTARVLASWFALFGMVTLAVVLDARWSATRIAAQSQLLGIALALVGVVRFWATFDLSNPFTWVVVVGGVGYAISLGLFYAWMEAL